MFLFPIGKSFFSGCRVEARVEDAGYGAPSALSEDRSTVIHKVEHAYVGS